MDPATPVVCQSYSWWSPHGPPLPISAARFGHVASLEHETKVADIGGKEKSTFHLSFYFCPLLTYQGFLTSERVIWLDIAQVCVGIFPERWSGKLPSFATDITRYVDEYPITHTKLSRLGFSIMLLLLLSLGLADVVLGQLPGV